VDVDWANKSKPIFYASFVIDCRKPHGINLVAEPRVTAGNAALLFLVPTTIRVYAKEKKLPPPFCMWCVSECVFVCVHLSAFSHPVCACVCIAFLLLLLHTRRSLFFSERHFKSYFSAALLFARMLPGAGNKY
jgi:hypothetical protein